ncbi:MAG: hypothetical protein WCH44_16930 [Betaproteobacteria bacterium]
MLKYLSTAEQSRFADLQGKLSELLITDTEQQELSALVGTAQKLAAERVMAIETVRKMIAENAIDIHSVFSAEAIARAAAGAASTARGTRKKSIKAKTVKPSARSKQVLIQVKLDKSAGAPSRYTKGQKLGRFVSRNFKQLDVGQQLVENLLKYATALGRTYFATPEGKAELEAFAQHVHKTPLNA